MLVSAPVAEYVSAPLLDRFTRRWPTLEVTAPEDFGTLLADRRADIALGPAPRSSAGVESVPFLRYKLVVVAGPRHPLAGERWLVGPGHDRRSQVADALRRARPGEVPAGRFRPPVYVTIWSALNREGSQR